MNLNELSKKIHQNAVNKGFWDKELSNEHCLMLVICELAEAIEADRKGKRANTAELKNALFRGEAMGNNLVYKCAFEEYIKDTVEDELADAVIRLLDLAGARGWEIDLTSGLDAPSYVPFISIMFCFTKYISITGAQVVCRKIPVDLIKYAETLGIDLEWHIKHKMKYNELRERLHGKAY